jgi:SNF2 family DNA or RNA helicase
MKSEKLIGLDDGTIVMEVGGAVNVLSAAEICGVIFEGCTTLKGRSISAKQFEETGAEFSDATADPFLELEVKDSGSGPSVVCSLKASFRSAEAGIGTFQGEPVDYVVINGVWHPLPDGAVVAAKSILGHLGISPSGQIGLAEYLKLTRLDKPALEIRDRTGSGINAMTVAGRLLGDAPAGFQGKLYDYQRSGYRWLSFMMRNGVGSIIADEMGLGKTVQVICAIIEIRASGKVPVLVVAPTTLLENWRRELSRFAPHLNVLVHRGARRTGRYVDFLDYDVVLTSVDTAVSDISLMRSIQWSLLVVDEAQMIKTPTAKRTRHLKSIPRACSIAITGTPVENRLHDLWSITDFVVPDLLGSLNAFEQTYPDNTDGATALEPVVSPIILRRLVRHVGKDLPERIDIPQVLELDPASARAYDTIRATVASQSSNSASIEVLQQLRMFCTHPWLTNNFADASALDCSVKLVRLLEIMEELCATGGKAVIFTSYTRAIDLVASELEDKLGIYVDFIDGRVPVTERQTKVDAFSRHAGPGALVLNPRAAGVGLNITAANHVIHFNLEWNPAVEDQASARAHRRGQTRPVTIHRLLYEGTVEDVINDRMQRKRELASAAIVGTDGREHDIQDILRAMQIRPSSLLLGGNQ